MVEKREGSRAIKRKTTGTSGRKEKKSLPGLERDSLRITHAVLRRRLSEVSGQRDLLIQSLHRLTMSSPGGRAGGGTPPGEAGEPDDGGIAGGHVGGGMPALEMGINDLKAGISQIEWHCHLLIEAMHMIAGGHRGGGTPA
jgi:hypothetical protein